MQGFGILAAYMAAVPDVACFGCTLASSQHVCKWACSEEVPEPVDMGGEGFSVAFDPLDGSSIVDTNFAVGTILGIWPGDKLTGITGRDQVRQGHTHTHTHTHTHRETRSQTPLRPPDLQRSWRAAQGREIGERTQCKIQGITYVCVFICVCMCVSV